MKLALALPLALFAGSGCGIATRLDVTNQRLGTVNSQLSEANQRLADAQAKLTSVNQRLDGALERLDATNRKIDLIDQAVTKFTGLRPDPPAPR